MIQKFLLNIQMIWIIFIKMLKNIIWIETKLFVRGKKLNISLVFITHSYFAFQKNIRLYSIHYFVMKILNKGELQQIKFNHSSDIDFQYFINLLFKMYSKTIFFLSYWYYSCIRSFFTLQSEFFRKIIKAIYIWPSFHLGLDLSLNFAIFL